MRIKLVTLRDYVVHMKKHLYARRSTLLRADKIHLKKNGALTYYHHGEGR